ncbi:hypothetical protein F7725_010576 [Dissostichus mawsoni]|uniref:Uncharacterized protein n=1 Tax=Dissostichus mawsoni TaxID=36200 RepID=A0A7J5XRU8_DISMA|nr:hypothetical protein F7725_010576 [Dissostichus mawsoni]
MSNGQDSVQIWSITKDPGAGATQNLKDCLGDDSLVPSNTTSFFYSNFIIILAPYCKLFMFFLISEKVIWGNQDPIWPLSASGAAPSARIQYLSRHKRDFSAREDPHRKEEEEEEEEEEEASFSRKTPRPSSKPSQYEHIVRLSTPRSRRRSAQENRVSLCSPRPPHTPHCERSCPIWHVDPRLKTSAVITPRLLQLSIPKLIRPDFHSNRESVASIVSFASKTAQIPPRLIRLPNHYWMHPLLKHHRLLLLSVLSIFVSKAARKATASDRVEMLATPKQLSKNYFPPRDPEWSRNTVLSS